MYEHEVRLTDEIEGADLDLGAIAIANLEEQNLLHTLRPQDIRNSTLHRLKNDWEGHPAGTLVLYDGQEVLLFLSMP